MITAHYQTASNMVRKHKQAQHQIETIAKPNHPIPNNSDPTNSVHLSCNQSMLPFRQSQPGWFEKNRSFCLFVCLFGGDQEK
jgi:hypothetical protein